MTVSMGKRGPYEEGKGKGKEKGKERKGKGRVDSDF
jgi:hypothetical protein